MSVGRDCGDKPTANERILTQPFQLRAGSGVRTLLIASATLSILIVTFMIYQIGQEDVALVVKERIAELPKVPPEDLDLPVLDAGSEEAQGDRMAIGRGEKIHITLYPREGTRAKLELAVEDWKPLAGSANEFLLTKPDVRMRTQDGHAVRFTAERGTLEAERKSGGGLQPIRGTLIGNVEIRYDRLTRKQRAALPEEDRGRIDPDDLILVEVDEIEFDLEYSKLIAPGPIVVTARDMHLEAFDLEVRFDESSSRVDSIRLQHGGRIEFMETAEPEGRPSRQTQFTLVEWLRSSLQARLDERRREAVVRDAKAAKVEPTFSEEGIPIFRTRDAQRQAPKPPVRFFGLIEGAVRMTRLAADGTRTRLDADRLEIVRELSRGGESDDAAAVEPSSSASGSAMVPQSRIVLEWSNQLSIDPCLEDDVRCAASASSIVAYGSPAIVETADGYASCRRMSYDPQDRAVDLRGSVETPVVIVLEGQGVITGVAVRTEEIDDRLLFHVTGPGLLVQATAFVPPEDGHSAAEKASPTVSFTGKLDVFARYVTRTAIDLSTGITRRRERVMERAVFTGGVQMRDGRTGLDADRLELGFRRRGLGSKSTQSVETVSARGHVVLTDGMDRITCREIDVEMRPGPGDRLLVRSATARGDVVATQGSRVVKARDKLVVDFKTSPEGTSTRVHRLRAFGDVSVRDPVQQLEIDAHELDCTIENEKQIDKALILGDKNRPASLVFETLSVSGQKISFDAPQERADVPGAGRLSFMTDRGLDGRRVSPPVPVVVTWTDSMSYRGLENRAVFSGDVHATSRNTITYDSDELVVEFDDASPFVEPLPPVSDFPKFQAFVDLILNEPRPVGTVRRNVTQRQRFGKEPTRILATGRVVAMISEVDPQTGRITSRSRIAGPKLWVNLRPEVSKMQIEGAGTLLIEDLRPARVGDPAAMTTVSLFGATEDSGPSKTLIEWKDLMWYDFARNQTRFNGDVSLKHFSGSELTRIHRGLPPGSTGSAHGRATFLTSDALTVDFQTDETRAQRSNGRRVGGLSAGRLKQFQAFGSVVLQDEVEGLSVTADRIVFWNDRDLLGIYGNSEAKAHIVMRRPGELPTQVSVERLFYNLRTGDSEVSQPFLRSR